MLRILYLFFEILLGSEQLQILNEKGDKDEGKGHI